MFLFAFIWVENWGDTILNSPVKTWGRDVGDRLPVPRGAAVYAPGLYQIGDRHQIQISNLNPFIGHVATC